MNHCCWLMEFSAIVLIILLIPGNKVNAFPRPCDLWNSFHYSHPHTTVPPAVQPVPVVQDENINKVRRKNPFERFLREIVTPWQLPWENYEMKQSESTNILKYLFNIF